MTNIGIEPAVTAEWLDQRGFHGAAALIRRMANQQDSLRLQADELASDATHLTSQVQALEEQNRAFAERLRPAGWITDEHDRKFHRWAGEWWELGYRTRNPNDGYADTGWYLWGPVGSGVFGQWMAHRTADAIKLADQFIEQHAAQGGDTQ